MRQYFRNSDIIVRLGGEEFAILLSDSNLANAKQKLEAFRKTIEQSAVKVEANTSINFTISVGLTTCQKDSTYNLETMLKEADKYLYKAKDAGRNQVYTP